MWALTSFFLTKYTLHMSRQFLGDKTKLFHCSSSQTATGKDFMKESFGPDQRHLSGGIIVQCFWATEKN